MAENTLLFSGTGPFDALTFDATITEQHSRDAEATEHAVEQGANIVDHVRLRPDKLIMDAVLTDSPLKGTASKGRAAGLYEQIRLLQEQAKLLTIITGLRTYEDMVIESLGVTRTAKETGGVHLSISLKHIRLVQNKTTVVEVTREPIAKKKFKGGKQTTTELSNTEAQKYQSQAKAGLSALIARGGI